LVKLKSPFNTYYPDVYKVEGINEANNAYIINGSDYDIIYIQKWQ